MSGDAVEPFENQVCEQIRDFAMDLSASSRRVLVCESGVQRWRKNFAFLGEKGAECTLRLKLASGWQKIVFDAGQAPESTEIESWITESFKMLAPKKVSAQLEETPEK